MNVCVTIVRHLHLGKHGLLLILSSFCTFLSGISHITDHKNINEGRIFIFTSLFSTFIEILPEKYSVFSFLCEVKIHSNTMKFLSIKEIVVYSLINIYKKCENVYTVHSVSVIEEKEL